MQKTSSHDAGQVTYGRQANETTLVVSDECKEGERVAEKSVENDMDEKGQGVPHVIFTMLALSPSPHQPRQPRRRSAYDFTESIRNKLIHSFQTGTKYRILSCSRQMSVILAMCTVPYRLMDVLLFTDLLSEPPRELPFDAHVFSSCP